MLRDDLPRPSWLHGVAVEFDPAPAIAAQGTVYVGVNPAGLGHGLHAIEEGHCLVLTHKRASTAATCLTRIVMDEQRLWPEILRSGGAPFAGLTIIVEDASPDTCLSLAVLAARLAGQTPSAMLADYAERWEAGDTSTTGLAETSFGVLQGSLVHALMAFNKPGEAPSLQRALEVGCAFADAVVVSNADPSKLLLRNFTKSGDRQLFNLALAHVGADRETAARAIPMGTDVMLALELPGSGRHRLVRCLAFTESGPVRMIKSFLREGTYARDGSPISVMALHRPAEAGTGNDITFSVDPAVGVWMRKQWLALESAENRAWAHDRETRPNDAPRVDMHSWGLDLKSEGVTPVNQPWWEGKPLYTILAAPKRLPDGRSGSKLTWEDALHTFWRTACPLAAYDLRSTQSGEPIDIFEPATAGNVARWKLVEFSNDVRDLDRPQALGAAIHSVRFKVGPSADDTVLAWDDTTSRVVAGYVALGHSRIDQLPDPSDFGSIHARGLGVVVSPHGIGILTMTENAGTLATLNELDAAVTRMSAQLQSAHDLEKKIGRARRETIAAIRSASFRAGRRALATSYAIISSALRKTARPPTRSTDPFVAEVEQLIERYWSAERRFNAVIVEAKQLREMTSAASDMRANEGVSFITRYGFPFALLVNMFAFALSDWPPLRDTVIWNGLKWGAVLAWLGVSTALVVLMMVIGRVGGRAWRRQLDEDVFKGDD